MNPLKSDRRAGPVLSADARLALRVMRLLYGVPARRVAQEFGVDIRTVFEATSAIRVDRGMRSKDLETGESLIVPHADELRLRWLRERGREKRLTVHKSYAAALRAGMMRAGPVYRSYKTQEAVS